MADQTYHPHIAPMPGAYSFSAYGRVGGYSVHIKGEDYAGVGDPPANLGSVGQSYAQFHDQNMKAYRRRWEKTSSGWVVTPD